MHGHTPKYEAFWIPDDLDSSRAVALGVKWLLEQPGDPLICSLPSK